MCVCTLWFLCVHVCTYTYMYVCTWASIYILLYIFSRKHAYITQHIFSCVHNYVILLQTCISICILYMFFLSSCERKPLSTSMHTYIHTDMFSDETTSYVEKKNLHRLSSWQGPYHTYIYIIHIPTNRIYTCQNTLTWYHHGKDHFMHILVKRTHAHIIQMLTKCTYTYHTYTNQTYTHTYHTY